MRHETDLTAAITTVINALELDRAGHVNASALLAQQLIEIDDKLEAARSLLAPNGPAAPSPSELSYSPSVTAMLLAKRATKRNGQWDWERARDYLAAHGGGPVDAGTLRRRIRSKASISNMVRIAEQHPRLFEVTTMPHRGRGYIGGVAKAIRLRRP